MTSYERYDSDADAKVAIASGDKNYQAKVAAAKQKNAAEIERLEAELAGLDAVLNAPADGAASGGGSDDGATGAANPLGDAVDEYVAAAQEEVDDAKLSPLEKKIDEIRDKGEALKDKLRKALAPDLDWSNADAVAAWWNENPEAAGKFLDESARIDAATETRVQSAREEDAAATRKKADEDAAKAAEKAAQEAAKQEEAAAKSVADFEAARADESKSNAEKRIDAIRKETAEYKKQLQTLLDLEKAKPDGERDDAKIAELQGKIDGADAAGKEREGAVLQEAQDAYFEKFASPMEKFAKAQAEFEAASRELYEAQKSGDERRLAAALEKQGAARSDFESARSAVERAVGTAESTATKPVSGTFSAYQAAADVYGAGNDWEKRSYEEAKEQTRLLREIERKGGATVATFA